MRQRTSLSVRWETPLMCVGLAEGRAGRSASHNQTTSGEVQVAAGNLKLEEKARGQK